VQLIFINLGVLTSLILLFPLTYCSQIWRLQTSISCILDEVDKVNEVVAIFNLLSSAARYQPALLISLIEQSTRAQADSDNSAHEQSSKYFVLNPSGSNPRLVEQILGYIGRSTELMDR
jgi:hypothetical protein